MFIDKLIKFSKWIALGIWGFLLVVNIFLWANGNPPEMSWLEIFLHEGALVGLCINQIIGDNNLY